MVAQMRERLGGELERLTRELAAHGLPQGGADGRAAGTEATVELQRRMQRRIRMLGQLVAGLASVDPGSIDADRAGYGSVVRLRDLATGEEETYTLMTGDFIDLDEGQVSLESPVGQALQGCRGGERVTVVAPRGERSFEVVSVTTLPQTLSRNGGRLEEKSARGGLQPA